jgi:hypothetical protein
MALSTIGTQKQIGFPTCGKRLPRRTKATAKDQKTTVRDLRASAELGVISAGERKLP